MNKKATALILTGMLLGSTATVFAAGLRKIEVYDNVNKVVVNKINKPFTKGEEPFTHNGRTYVPLRYVSDALGENVDWDGKTGTVYIGDRYSTSAHYWGKDINDMGYSAKVEYGHDLNDSIENNAGEEYSNYLKLVAYYGRGTSHAEFPLNGQYKKFTSKLGITKQHRNFSGNAKVTIFLDDKAVYTKTMKSGDMPQNISLDITGANKIKFQVEADNTYKDVGIMFGNGQFIKK